MSTAADEMPDGHTLDLALKANNLPTYGTKAMKWARLKSGETGKKKPGRKPKASTDSSSKFDAFSKAQMPGLVAMGIVDEDDQTTEIKRRWTAMMTAQSKTAKTAVPSDASTPSTIKLEKPLDVEQLKATGLTLVKTDTTGGKVLFIYKSSAVKDKKVAKVDSADGTSALKSKTAGIKRKKAEEEEEEEDDDDDDDDGDLDWACEVSKERLLKKCRKETLQSMCSDFGVPTSGSKEQLADILSEQLHAETDDEAGEEEE